MKKNFKELNLYIHTTMSAYLNPISGCERPQVSLLDKEFIQYSLKFYIACKMFTIIPQLTQRKIEDGVHEFLCNNAFSIIPTFTKKKNDDEIQEYVGKKVGELLKTLYNHLPINVIDLQINTKEAEEASNALYANVIPKIVKI